MPTRLLPLLSLPALLCAAVLWSVAVAIAAPEETDKPGTWPVARLQSEIPDYRIEDDTAPIQSLLYAGEPVEGKPTEVFAFYTSPKTLGKAEEKQRYPATIHGDNGIAVGLPAEANTWIVTLTDERDAMVSSEVRFRENR